MLKGSITIAFCQLKQQHTCLEKSFNKWFAFSWSFNQITEMSWIKQRLYRLLNDHMIKQKLLPAPKITALINTAVIGWKHCNKRGMIHALNVNSSDTGATIWFLSHTISVKVDFIFSVHKNKTYYQTAINMTSNFILLMGLNLL